MKNKELFDRANADGGKELQAKFGRDASRTAEADTVCERLSQSQKMRIY